MSLQYRPEIDGLRAVAVMAVVIFHAEFLIAGKPLLSGGFLGVDVFFVISGYLITALVLRALQNNNFSLAHFYERRARRILPALFAVFLCSLPFAWYLMLPDALKEYAGANLSSLLFSSNFWFWQEESYFAQPALLKPFLHTWSLSVEEQFYVVFPAALLLLWKFARRSLFIVLLLLGVLSLGLSHYMSGRSADAAFYLLPFRGWELLAGALLAKIELTKGRFAVKGISAMLPSLGLAMIVVSFVVFDKRTLHPSAWTLIPVMGTVLVLYFSAPREPITRLLSLPIFVGVGLISYSLYLWHFTVFAFARIHYGEVLELKLTLGLIALAFGLSILTYFLVEKPARNGRTVTRKVFTSMAIMVFTGLLAANGFLFMSGGAPMRMGAVTDLVEAAKRTLVRQDGEYCIDRSVKNSCYFPASGAQKTLILIGDSHAEAISRALLKTAQNNKTNVRLFLEGGCPLIPKTYRHIHKIDKQNKCIKKAADVEKYIKSHPDAVLIYFSYMTHYLGFDAFEAKNGELIPMRRASIVAQNTRQGASDTIAKNAQEMFENWLHENRKLLLVYPVPEARVDVPKAFKTQFEGMNFIRSEDVQKVDFSSELYDHRQQTKRVHAVYDSIGKTGHVYRLDPADIFCMQTTQRCTVHDDELFYSDTNHLSPHGAEKLVSHLKIMLEWQ